MRDCVRPSQAPDAKPRWDGLFWEVKIKTSLWLNSNQQQKLEYMANILTDVY